MSSTTSPPSLLLLPLPPPSLSRASLKAAYQPALTAALRAIASTSTRTSPIAVLDIVVPWPALRGQREKPRSHIFGETQHLLAEVYSLISIVGARENIELDGPGGIDSRVLLLEYDDASVDLAGEEGRNVVAAAGGGPIIDLPTLALTRRNWNLIFAVDGEQGQAVFTKYRNAANSYTPPLRGQIRTVPGGTTVVVEASKTSQTTQPSPHPSSRTHSVVAVGGTFDHLHAGHKLLLTCTALMLQPPAPSTTSS
ncbi:hypothetical protein V493_07976, partial [Pseudogymnoascus sp. VKM F-4281 (FW-2241)]